MSCLMAAAARSLIALFTGAGGRAAVGENSAEGCEDCLGRGESHCPGSEQRRGCRRWRGRGRRAGASGSCVPAAWKGAFAGGEGLG